MEIGEDLSELWLTEVLCVNVKRHTEQAKGTSSTSTLNMLNKQKVHAEHVL